MPMAEFDATVRKVGDSLGVIIPHPIIEQLHAQPGEKIRVVIPRKVDWSMIWGRFRPAESTDALIRKARTRRD